MVHRQAGEGKMLSHHTPAKEPFALEPAMCFPSGAGRRRPAIRGRDLGVFSLRRLTPCWFPPPVVAAGASPRARVPPQVRPDRTAGFCLPVVSV